MPLFFWSAIYAIRSYFRNPSIKSAIVAFFHGEYHMWFLFMIVGLYMLVPFLQKIVESEKLTKYFLLLTFVFTFLIPQFINMLAYVWPNSKGYINTMLNKMSFHFTLGYVGYFVLGYYLSKKDLTTKGKKWIAVFSVCGFLFTIGATAFLSWKKQSPDTTFYEYTSLNVLLEAIGIFVFVKCIVEKKNFSLKGKKCIQIFSKYSFGAYLIHCIILEELNNIFGLNTLAFHPILSVVSIAIIVFGVSMGISVVCHKIPILKRYIV